MSNDLKVPKFIGKPVRVTLLFHYGNVNGRSGRNMATFAHFWNICFHCKYTFIFEKLLLKHPFLQAILSKISVSFKRRSVAHLGHKLSVIEDYCSNYNSATFLAMQDLYRKRFSLAISMQYAALFRAETFRPDFLAGIVVTALMGGLYLIWCDVDIETENISVRFKI